MVPMRDGVRLQTLIVVPRDAEGPFPFILDRGPYGFPPTQNLTRRPISIFSGCYVVYQNIRGRFQSEGEFVMLRPPCRPNQAKCVDETTDAWDTVDWLTKNLPNNSGRVVITGGSYDGWTAVMAALNPHPAVKAIIEEASPADMFLGDDFHHNGAFRLSYGFDYTVFVETNKIANSFFQFDQPDMYDWFLSLGPLSSVNGRYFHNKLPTWNEFTRHPNYDRYWTDQAVAPYLNAVKVPILNIAGWWDPEDFYGPLTIYGALAKHDTKHRNYLIVGPWNHGSWRGTARRLGAIDFGSDTAQYYARNLLAPWLSHWLWRKGEMSMPGATVFETGSNQWKRYDSWPPKEGIAARRLFLGSNRRLSFDASKSLDGYEEYVSDPASPVPYLRRPVKPTFQDYTKRVLEPTDWPNWLVQDQRFVDGRPDVLSWTTEPLSADLHVLGNIVAELFASTSGTDSDWVVKLIDAYPEDWTETNMRGFELIIASEIFRARFRNSFEHPEPVPSNEPLKYTIDLHANAHCFRKGHRIMVQVQSSWFPLYDRNPQKWVPNIFNARQEDYLKAVQRIYRGARRPSAITLQVREVL
jgi:putative CocE/NonD family hydrolase